MPWLFPFLIGHCDCVFLLLCWNQLILFTNLQRGHVGTFLVERWYLNICLQKGVHDQHTGPRQPACMNYQPIQYCWVHTCPLPRLPSSYMPFTYGYPTSSSTQTGEHLVYHLMLMVWTRPNANQCHVCTMGSGIGGMGGLKISQCSEMSRECCNYIAHAELCHSLHYGE